MAVDPDLATTSKETINDTLVMLEQRLHRIEYALHGQSSSSSGAVEAPNRSDPASIRLRRLERGLHDLSSKSSAVAEVLALHDRYPDLFHSNASTEVPSSLSPSSLAALVLSHADLYTSVSSQLQQLAEDSSIPDSSAMATLVSLRPRIEKFRKEQQEQANAIAELRARSARVVEAWYEGQALRMADQWAGWEERLTGIEILVRRAEARDKRDKQENV